MKITGVEVFPLTISFKKVIEESFGTVGKREDDVVIKLYTDEGVTVWAKAAPSAPFIRVKARELSLISYVTTFSPRFWRMRTLSILIVSIGRWITSFTGMVLRNLL